ncbi:MAG: hypothetical protein R8G34_15740 [Paracoccaceae bacterium]|nr:hypothetical protein [Paracoccaceae bacterium]
MEPNDQRKYGGQTASDTSTGHCSIGAGTADREIVRVGRASDDPRLVDLVRLLARQAARDFVEAETARHGQSSPRD